MNEPCFHSIHSLKRPLLGSRNQRAHTLQPHCSKEDHHQENINRSFGASNTLLNLSKSPKLKDMTNRVDSRRGLSAIKASIVEQVVLFLVTIQWPDAKVPLLYHQVIVHNGLREVIEHSIAVKRRRRTWSVKLILVLNHHNTLTCNTHIVRDSPHTAS